LKLRNSKSGVLGTIGDNVELEGLIS